MSNKICVALEIPLHQLAELAKIELAKRGFDVTSTSWDIGLNNGNGNGRVGDAVLNVNATMDGFGDGP